MEAVVYTGLGNVEIQEIGRPDPGPGEALVRMHASGVCHTDIAILHGQYGNSSFPIVPGHEYSGTVESVGPGVTSVAVGDRVVVDPNIGCGHCRSCRKGLSNLCSELGAYGVSRNGGFAEFSVVSADNLVPVGDMPFELAALAEPMGCVLNGIDAIGTDGVDEALVFGAGPIGILMALALRTRGVLNVGLVDIDESRLELAATFDLEGFASGSGALDTKKGQLDLAVDATGVPSVAAGLTSFIADGGKALLFGVCPPEALIEISPFDIFRRQLTVAGAHSLNHNIPEALDTIGRVGPDIGRLVTDRVPLSEILAFLLGHTGSRTLKVQAAP